MKDMSADDILKLARNFMESRIMLSGAELNLFTMLAKKGLTARQVAKRTGSDLRALTVLLDALAALGFVVKDKSGAYRASGSASRFLSEDSPDSVLPMVLHGAHLWDRWTSLTGVVRGEPLSGGTLSWTAPEMRAFIGAMHVVAKPQAKKIVQAVRPGKARALIDVGGASGTYTIAFLQAVPEMRATLFDLPEVIEMARKRFKAERLLRRVTLVGGDFEVEELPGGHDLAFVSAIIHQNDVNENIDLYGKVFRSLKSGGRIVIRDHVMEPDRIHPKDGAIFAVNMLVGTRGGGTYTFEEIKGGLEKAGFVKVCLIRKGEVMDSLVEAFKP